MLFFLDNMSNNALIEEDSGKNRRLVWSLRKLWKNGIFRSAFLIILVVVGVLVFRQALIWGLRTEYPLQTPISGSMRPTLYEGDLLIVQGGFTADQIYAHLNDGDIIVFRDPRNMNDFIVHRAIEKYQQDGVWYFITKGDNNPSQDYWLFPRGGVPVSYLIGKVIWHIPYLGYIKIYLGTPTGILITVLLIVIFLLIENLVGDIKEKKRTPLAEPEKPDKLDSNKRAY